MNAKSIWPLLAGTLLLSACSLLSSPEGGLSLVATVGTEADTCADAAEITTFSDAPTTVYYCYTITNTGDLSVPVHDLSDDLFGVILSDFAYDLAPGASVDTVAAGVVLAYEVSEPTVNAATWEGFARQRRVASAEASTTVTPVPPLQYGAVAGTVTGGSNLGTIGAFSGNVVLLGVLDLAGDPIAETLDVTITAPGFAPFVYTYDPADTLDGVVALILDDFEASLTPAALGALGVPTGFVRLERLDGVARAAAVGGDFVFEFPGETLVRTVDAAAAIALPEVTAATPDAEADAIEVTFTEDADASVVYAIEAYGLGANAYVGAADDVASPVTVALDGALEPGESFMVDVTAVRGGDDVFADAPAQVDLAQYYFVGTVEVP
jgi:hypothetical protein